MTEQQEFNREALKSQQSTETDRVLSQTPQSNHVANLKYVRAATCLAPLLIKLEGSFSTSVAEVSCNVSFGSGQRDFIYPCIQILELLFSEFLVH